MNDTTIKNLLLVNPKSPPNTFWSFHYSLDFINKKCAMPPLGLVTLAALIPDDFNIRLVDLNIDNLTDDHIDWADAVFLTGMLVQKESFHDVVQKSKQAGKIVVAGGSYATSSHEEITGVDHFVLGEVEDTFQAFLHELRAGTAKKRYPPPERPDIRQTITPRFDLLDTRAYSSMAIQYSRGCPFKCEFCDIWSVFGNKPRLKSPESIIDELETLYRLNWRGAVFIVDDNFIGNKNRVKQELLPAITRWQKNHNYPYRFFTEASINLAADEKLLSGMREAGFNEVFIGIESPSPESLKETGKMQNLKTDMQQAINTIQQYGMEVMAGFIIGFDSDTEEVAASQISFIQQTGIPQAMIGLLNALPGTQLYKRLKQEGRLTKSSGGNNTHSLDTNFTTRMGPEKLKNAYVKILSTIYDSNLKNYFARCKTLLDNIGDTPLFQREIHFAEIKMLLKSLLRQPFTRYGFQYLKFLLRNLIKNTSTFGEAVRFAIIGHHFHIITQQTLKVEKISTEIEKSYNYLREKIIQQSVQLMDNSKETLTQITKLWAKKDRMLGRLKKRISHVHLDFQWEMTAQLNEFENRLQELFDKVMAERQPIPDFR